ncbi:MAG: NYN domain-containing protein [Verrucomicrobiales bacterium]|nr:NYN domain-containing protein [Verrucomicrobiales bacterium]
MNESRPSFLLVDGNNIIHAWPDLLTLHRRRRGSAHPELIRRLGEHQDFSGDRVVVVFDGRGVTTTEERQAEGLQIFYTSASHTADDIIERLAIKYAAQYDITVATDDRAEQDIVVGAGGSVLSSDGLRDRLDAAERSMRDWIKRHRKR